MSKVALNSSDWLTSGNPSITPEGSMYFDNIRANDFNVGLVSKDVFHVTTNKSIVFKFKADPYTEYKNRRLVWFNADHNIYLNKDKKIVVDGNVTDVDGALGTVVKGDNDNQLAITGGTLSVFGDDTNKQVSEAPTDVVDADVSNKNLIYIYLNDDHKAQVAIKGDDSLSVPDSINNYSSDTETPVKVAIGNGFFIVTKKNSTIEFVGDKPVKDEINNKNLAVKSVITSGSKVGILYIDHTLDVYDVEDDMILKVYEAQQFNISNDSVITTMLYGKTYVTPFAGDVTSIALETKYPVVLAVSGTDTFTKTQSNKIVGTKTFDIIDFSLDDTDNADYDNYPQLKNSYGMNVLFGLQQTNLNEDYIKYVTPNGEQTEIIKGNATMGSMFEALAHTQKGYCLSKHVNGADLFYNFKTQPKGEFLVDNFQVLPEEFVTFGDEIYTLVISFTPFGKAIRMFKDIDGRTVEVISKFLSVEEYPFESARMSIYIKDVSSFELIESFITDELSTLLLPEEIIYRDIDTDVLQTKVAESLNKHIETMGGSVEAVEAIAGKMAKMVDTYSKRFTTINDRLDALESN